MVTKQERTQTIDRLAKVFQENQGIYVTDIHGISVDQITRLRAGFREEGVTYMVVKNTLARIALSRIGREDLAPHFRGPIGVALAGEDGLAPARIIRDFQKANKELLPVRVASLDGALMSAEETAKLADVPSREVLLAQMLGCLKAPLGKFAAVLNAVPTKLAATVEAVKQKKEQN